ncbi:MAG: PQQ-binding-like beta-propeller repeat protein, partial [Phycisphaeraceae bacterium]|nr:PQQ-binding-like beta-propeller repeat protein [Phycisphaeraceae bacterium]
NGRAEGEKISPVFPVTGPKVVWSMKLGSGYAGPAVRDGKVIVFHRRDDRAVVECRNLADGRKRWSFDYPTDYVDGFNFDDGPRAVPAIDGRRVYTFGAEGMLHALNLADGEKLWSVDTRKKFKTEKGYFGRVCSPWIENDRLLLNLGGQNNHGLVAIDAETGKVLWGSTNHPAGYASPVGATLNGRRYGLFFTRTGLVALDPADGKVDFIRRWRSRMDASVNAACPVVHDDQVFVSACYETGALMVKITPKGPRKVWSGDSILDSHYTTPIYHRGFLYGFHGRQERAPDFRCVDWKTGQVRWKKNLGGAGSVTAADDKLIVLTENGKLLIGPAGPDGFRPTAEAKILGSRIRAYPALSNGFFLARDEKKLVCLRLGPP